MALSDGDTQPIRPLSGLKDSEFVCADCEIAFNPMDPPGQKSNRFCPKCVSRHYPPETGPFRIFLEDGKFPAPDY